MQKYLVNALIVVFLTALAGCQSSAPITHFFNPSPASGMTLAQAVQDALIRSNDPVIAQVHVETNQNVVFLSGYVKKIRQSDVAEQIARQVPGVQNVENHLIVRQ